MDKKVCRSITAAVPFLQKKEARKSLAYLQRPYQHAIRVMQILEDDGPVDGVTIAEALGLHRNTVYAILGALREGGYKITESVEGASKMLKGERRVL